MREKNWQKPLPWLVVIALLALWECCVRIFDVPLYVLPGPIDVLAALGENAATLFSHAMVTSMEAIAGMLIALALGLLLGVLMDAFPLVRRCVYPLLVVTQTVPMIVLAPILIIYLGFGVAPKILTVVLMCFFPVAVNFTDGMSQVGKGYVDLVRSYGASRAQVYALVKLPAALPPLFSGLRVAATYSISGAVVGEWIGSQSGLGYYLLRVKESYMLDRVFACVVVIVALSLLMNGIVRLCQYIFLPFLRRAKG
ncbi:MAG TPA: ABC transporter permease [Candidatus Pullichristensenella avicola]|nr:ABC transporter permease [Candidatus Pullichristensenella avicola]